MKTTDQSRLYRIELHLLTYMWNEGFEKADQPWLQLYTDNGEWAKSLPERYSISEANGLEQEFKVKVKKLAAGSAAPTQEELDEGDWDLEDDEELKHSARFFALSPGLTADKLDAVLQLRLSQWDGI